MKRLHTLRYKFSLAIALACLLTVVSLVLCSNLLVNRQFASYLTSQQQEKTQNLISTLWLQYQQDGERWNGDSIHAVGMYALSDGFFIKVLDAGGNVVWDALFHDMSACSQIMDEIQARMEHQYPRLEGQLTSSVHSLESAGSVAGTVEISYYGPFFLSEQDFDFIHTLNLLFFAAGIFSLALAAALGGYLGSRLSRPILRAADISSNIAQGNYQMQIAEKAGTMELDLLISAVNHLATALDQQEQLRKKLTADVAHELRTPLTTVATHLEAMVEGVWEPAPERLNVCLAEINRITGLVADLENLSRLENQLAKLKLQPTALLPLVKRCLDSLSLTILEKRLLVETSGPPELCIMADVSRLHQAVHNLLSNAVKYTLPGGAIHISLETSSGEAALSIMDTGSGIAADDLPFIFERFYRADASRSRATGGSGIGLAVVSAVVKAHHGRVTVKSQLGKGSVFTLYFPVAEEPPADNLQ